jgi:hypothetical protein
MCFRLYQSGQALDESFVHDYTLRVSHRRSDVLWSSRGNASVIAEACC